MKFKDWKHYDKQTVLNTWKYRISKKALILLKEDNIDVYRSTLNHYIEYLLEDTDYDPKTNVFYEPHIGFKFSIDLFANITYEYVLEHLDEFKIMK